LIRHRLWPTRAARIAEDGRHVEIKSNVFNDENSLEALPRIIPQEKPLTNCRPTFTLELAPFSVNILKIPAGRALAD
jgi:hypothetical protein